MASSHVKFVATDADGLPVKRKQVQQACEACRKRKKRCIHNLGVPRSHLPADHSGEPADADSPVHRHPGVAHRFGHVPNSRLPPSPESPGMDVLPAGRPSQEDPSAEAASGLVELSSSRFIGDLNPEGIFIQATTSDHDESHPLYRDKADIGTWFPPGGERPDELDSTAAANEKQNTSARTHPPLYPSITLVGRLSYPFDESSWYNRTRHNYILNECLKLVPPDEDFEALRAIFLERIHPILPIFNTSDVEGESPSKISRTIIKQIISLSAAMEPKAVPHLRLERGGPLLAFREFHRRLAHAIFQILDANLLISRVDHIRVLIMMSLFYQPSCSAERDLPSLLSSQAIHYAQSLGIQLLGYRPQRQDENIEQLFCAVWALDRLTATIYGKACALHERDIDRDLDDCIEKQPTCFRLFLRVMQYLDRVIDLYRPRSVSTPIDLPVFEGLVLDAGAEKVPSVLLGTIETLYHTVSVLSVRQSPSLFTPSAGERAHLPHHSINPRRSLSADRIVQVVQSEDISLLPWIPYAVSLSLSVSYRKMRYSRVPMYRVRARGVFKDIVELLKKVGEVYSSARINAELGESILREMEKTVNSLTAPAEAAPPGRKDGGGTAQDQESSQAGESITVSVAHRGEQTAATPASSGADTGAINDFEGINPIEGGGPAPLDPVILGNPEDIDLFGYFDPGFNLGAVDAALEANLDMSYPQNWTAPWYQTSG